MSHYEPLKIEQKWQKRWEETQAFACKDLAKQPKMYLAEMFPYPSSIGLHVGHVRNFSIVDCLARFYAQNGMNVMRPFGYDTFGLPAENYAIKTGIAPQAVTKTNIDNFRKQAKRLGFAIDWSREINTSDPEYYKWTQWCFLQLYKKGLAYQAESFQWWCPEDKTVLANEQVENGHCWRCGAEVEKKKMKQWFFKITAYADELLDEIDALDWPEKIKTMQKNWIGRSEGAEIDFAVADQKDTKIRVFTTRPDTLFGATFMVLAPENTIIPKLVNDDAREAVQAYCETAIKKSEIERQENKEKTGVFTGAYAINPANGAKIPIWVADYVLSGYGTGAVMAVPAHDQRDHDFAEKFDLPIVKVIEKPETAKDDALCYDGEGTIINSADFNGQDSADVREAIVAWLEQQGLGNKKVTYRMRDWLISRQRYWGCPIPIAYDKNGKAHAIPEDQLPVTLPKIDDYKPDESGRSALAKSKEFTKVIIDGEEMTRETDTLDGYACSSWYLWRYTDPHNKKAAWDKKKVNYWAPTDIYCGGDHAVAHLLYVRFWCKFFADEGYLDFREPIKKLLYNGYINASDGKKMSKSKGNGIDPLDVIDQGYGADTLRTYELFIGPYNLDASWSTEAIGGVYRFLNRCWTLCFDKKTVKADANISVRHKTIKKVTDDIRRANFNTAVASLMEYVNQLFKTGANREDLIILAKLLKPFAPHLACEMLETLQADDTWPQFDETYLQEETVELVVQINGKLRARIAVASEHANDAASLEKIAKDDAKIKSMLADKTIVKTIVVTKNHLVNIVVK
ncbi:leucine--tRNA ligase [Candidatus Saccharibacteria bacterium]|nr:leucine--tRNA ligase [Candidatus Saccharibacteria bacterium]